MADNRFAKSLLVVMLSVFILLGYIPLVSAADNEQKAKQRVVVSMGDSYSSGEGIDDFYGSEKKVSERVKDRDWLAHRSKNSWPGMLMLKDMPEGKSLKDYKVNDAKNHNPDNEFEWYFVASSGAETKDLCYGINDKGENKKGQKKEYKKGDYEGKAYLPKQIETLTELRKKGVTPDYITLTIGGNDAGFETIIKESILCGEGYGSANVLRAQFAYTWSKFYEKNGIRDNIKKTYKTISKATDNKATIIVAGYPKLLSTFGHPGEFALRECNIINDNVSKFNNAIKDIVDECSSGGMNIVFVSVEDTFNGHGAYSINEYLNGVVYIPKEQDLKDLTVSAYSMHPNIKGARAYAQCVQNKLMELEKWSAKIPNKDIEGGARAIESKVPTESTLTPLTEEQIDKAFTNYMYDKHPEQMDYINRGGEAQCGWWIGEIKDNQTVVTLRFYTGAYAYYYIDVVSGETYVTEEASMVDVKEHPTGEKFNIRDYLNRTMCTSTPIPPPTLPETTPLGPTQGSTMNPESQSAKQIAYAAYLKVLQNNKKAIKAYKKMNVFDSMKKEDGWLGGYWFGDKPLIQKSSNKNCALCELTGDTIPELLFVTSKKNKVKFHVYTYNSSKGKAVEILSLNLSTYEPNRYLGYALYRTKDNRLVFFSDYGLGNGDSGNNADVYKYNGKKMKVVDSYRAVGTAPTYFKINKKNTSYKNFESKKKKLVNSTEQVIFYTVIWDSVSGQVTRSKKLKSVSMSYEGCEKILKG